MRKRIVLVAKCMLIFILSFSTVTMNSQATNLTTFNSDKPRVVLDGFKVSDDVVVPGENFDLTFTLRNPSSTYSVNSILLTFTNDIKTVVPIYGQADQVYIDKLPAGGKTEVTVTLAAAEIITTTSIKFEIDVTFSNDESSNNNNLITIQLPITKTSKFKIQNVSLPENVYVGNKTRIHVTYKNLGVDNFYNVTMNIDGEEFKEMQQVGLGSLVAGKISYAEAYVNFIKDGEQKAKISFNYEDIEGNKFSTDVYEKNFTAIEREIPESKDTVVSAVTSSGVRVLDTKIILFVSIGAMTIVVLLLIRKYNK